MPDLNPPNLRRGTPPDQQGSGQRDGTAGGQPTRRSAEDVYGFLTDFTAGVQRGLDESGAER